MRSADTNPLSLGRALHRGLSTVALAGALALAGVVASSETATAQSAAGGGRSGNTGGGASTGGGTSGGASSSSSSSGGSTSGGRSGGTGSSYHPAGAVILPQGGPTERDYIDPVDDEHYRPRRRQVRRPVEEPRIVMPTPGDERLVPGEVLVELRKGVKIEPIATRLRLEVMGSTTLNLSGAVVHRLRGRGTTSTPDLLRRLGGEPGVAFAQPDYVHTLQEETAAVSPVSVSGAATAPSPPPLPGQYVAVKIDLAAAHGLATGRGVTIGVVDTAVDQRHPDLAGIVAETFDAIGGGSGEPAGHGTAMAGAIAAHGRLVGTAPGARLLVARAFGDPGAAKGSQGTSFHVVGGLDWVVTKGARVVSLSFAGPRDALLGRELAAARAKGVVVVAAAGNAGPQSPPLYPAAEPGVIAVTASDADDHVFTGANRGRHVAVTAPGVDVLVAAPAGGYDLSTGTSVAAAEVAGVVALMLEGHAAFGETEVRRRLQASAHDLGEPGIDPVFGAGLVDAGAAVK